MPPARTEVARFAMLAAILEGLPVGVAVHGGAELQAAGYARQTFMVQAPPHFGPAQEPWVDVAGYLLFWHARPPEFIPFEDGATRTIAPGDCLPWGVRTLPSTTRKA